MDEIELLKPSDAARRLGVTADHVVQLCRSGRLPAAKIGNRWRVIWPLALKQILSVGGEVDVDPQPKGKHH